MKIFCTFLKFIFLLFFPHLLISQNKINGNFDSDNNFFNQYDKKYLIENFNGEYAKFSKGGYYGIINKNGEILIPLEYDEVLITDTLFYANKYNENFIFNIKGEIIDKPLHDLVLRRNGRNKENFYYDQFNSNEGVIKGNNIIFDSDFKEIKKLDCDRIYHFNEGISVVIKFTDLVNSNFNCGYINKKGEIILPIENRDCTLFSNGRATFLKEGVYSIIDKNGSIIRTFNDKSSLSRFSDGLCRICKERKCGFIDVNGVVVIPLIYDFVNDFRGGFSKVIKNGLEIFINTSGKEFQENKAGFEDGYRFKRVNENFYVYENILGEKIFDFEGEIKSPHYKSGLVIVEKNGKKGAIDRVGTLTIPNIYDDLRIENGSVIAKEKEKVWILNKKGEKLLIIYDNLKHPTLFPVDSDYFGFIKTNLGNKTGLASFRGKLILPNDFEKYDIHITEKYIFTFKDNNLKIYNHLGKLLFQFNNYLKVSYNDEYFFIEEKNNLHIYDNKFKIVNKISNISNDELKSLKQVSWIENSYVYQNNITKKYGYVLTKNFKIHNPIYDHFRKLNYSNKIIFTLNNSNYILNNTDGNVLMSDFENFREINSNLLIKWKGKDEKNNFNNIDIEEVSMAIKPNKRKYALIDTDGNFLIDYSFNYIHTISELPKNILKPKNSFFYTIINRKYTFYDKNGNLIESN
ncbi:MAG: WG repeat-containing protein [Flavobacterium sp.]